MQPVNPHSLVALLGLLLFCVSCEKAVFDDAVGDDLDTGMSSDASSAVRVITRAATGASLVYPLRIYVFSQEGTLIASSEIQEAEASSHGAVESFQLMLPQSQPSHIVVFSADDSSYCFPEKPTSDALITACPPLLPDTLSDFARRVSQGFSTAPLQMGVADITPTGGKATVSLQMHYQVASLSVALYGLPPESRSAYLSISSPATGISLYGNYSGTQTTRIPLTRPSGTSSLSPLVSGTYYVLPSSSGSNSINFTISYTDEEGEQFATVHYLSPLQAGTPYTLRGTYADGVLAVSGSVSPATWSAPVSLDFGFSSSFDTTVSGESHPSQGEPDPNAPDPGNGNSGDNIGTGGNTGSQEDGSAIAVTAIPSSCSLWNGHVVVSAGKDSVLLLSLVDYAGMTSALNTQTTTTAFSYASTYKEYDLTSGWRLPTISEARQLRLIYLASPAAFHSLLAEAGADDISITDSKGKSLRYLCDEALHTFSFKSNGVTNAGMSIKNYHMRLVRTVKMKLTN